METNRVHRRKLHFSSLKDAASVATVTVDRSPKRPNKRRKRQQRSRRLSSAPAFETNNRSANGLAEATWSCIQERFTAAKSLGGITRIMLQFFKEHEDMQCSASEPVFPIFVPSSEIYKMKVPRKRRIYDVLHVLEGIGVIKRVRCDETRRTKGGYFLYYGKAAVVQRLAEMKSVSTQAKVEFRQSRHPKTASVVEEDSAIVEVFEKQAATEKWPCLVTTTVCFLGLLFQQDYHIGVTLPAVSSRLVEAKKFIGASESSSWIETPYSDVHRRVYDVMSVLASCNMVDTALGSSCDPSDKCFSRKYARFNYNIFTDPKVLFAARDSGSQWKNDPACESMSGAIRANLRDVKSPPSKDRLVSSPLMHRRSAHVGTALDVSSIFSPAVVQMSDASYSDAANWGPSCHDKSVEIDLQCSASPYTQQGPVTKCLLGRQAGPRIQDLFSPLGKELTEGDEWYDESLKQIGLHEATQIDWNLSSQPEDSYSENWGLQHHGAIAPYAFVETVGQRFQVDKVEVGLTDLDYKEMLVEDISSNPTSFFC